MASPLRLYIVPDCGLKINIEDSIKNAYLYDHNKPVNYSITDTQCFAFKNTADYDLPFQGILSPSNELTLPSEIRKIAGIPSGAMRFAYMYPPSKLASFMDWEKQKTFAVDTYEDHPKTHPPSSNKKYVDEEAASLKTGGEHAMILGAYVYFGKDMEILQVNALSLEPSTKHDIKFTGPWEIKKSAIEGMQELKRVQKIEADIFNEAGFVGFGWINPGETFQSETISAKFDCINGAFIYIREDGSGIAYQVEGSNGVYFPHEDVEMLVDCVRGLNLALERGNVTFNMDTSINFLDLDGWKKLALSIDDGSERKYRSTKELIWELKSRNIDESYLIHKACQVGLNADYIDYLLKDVGNKALNAIDGQGWTPLHYACRFSSSNVGLIEYLLRKNRDAAQIADRFDRLPLHLACDDSAPIKVVQALIQAYRRAVVKETKNLGVIPLHIACNREANIKVVKALLDADIETLSVRKRSVIGRLPLHMAIEEKMHPDVVDLLLEKGNEEDIYTRFAGLLPIHLACLNGSDCKTIKILLEKDQRDTPKEAIEEEENSNSLTTIGINGMIPLHLALKNASIDSKTRKRQADTIRLLLMTEKMTKRESLSESTVYFRNKYNQKSPLHLACQNNASIDIIQLLLDLDPTNEVMHFKDRRGMKPIHYACNKVDADSNVVELLLAQEKRGISKAQIPARKMTSKDETSQTETTSRNKKKLSSSLDSRNRSPLLTAIRTGAPNEIIEILTRPEYLYLKGFDDESVHILGKKINDDEEMKNHIVSTLSERCYFTMLFIEFYAHIAAIGTFIPGSERLLNNTLTTFEPAVLSICIVIFIIRELAQLKSQGWNYFKDIWNAPELLSVICLTASVVHMTTYLADGGSGDFEVNRDLMIATGILLIVTFIFFCRATFLPFARFVGGLLLILTTLVPFFTVSSLLLLAFTYSFRISGDHEAECTTLMNCYLWTLQGFFSGSDDTNDTLDILFGIIAIVILLNVVVAIVGDAWELATKEASSMYWSFRVSYLLESRAFAIIQRKLPQPNFLRSLTEKIDKVQDIVFNGNGTWSKGVYSHVTTRDQYERPEFYFTTDMALKIKNARSLKADLHWAKVESNERLEKQEKIREKIKKQDSLSEEEEQTKELLSNRFILRQIAFLSFISRCLIFILLVILGIPFGGWFWPVRFRHKILSLGVDETGGTFCDVADKKPSVQSNHIADDEDSFPGDMTESESEDLEDLKDLNRTIPFVGTASSLSLQVPSLSMTNTSAQQDLSVSTDEDDRNKYSA